MAFPYDDSPPTRDPALPPLDQPSGPIGSPININMGAPAPGKMTDAQAAALSAELAKMPGGAPTAAPSPSAGPTLPAGPAAPVGAPATPLNTPGFVQGLVGLTDESKKGYQDLANEQIGLNNQSAEIKEAEFLRGQKELEENTKKRAADDKIAEQHDLEARAMARQLAAKEIDPEKYWNSKSTGQKILATIGLALGSLGGGLTKSGQNIPLQMMNQAIMNDIDSQKANMDKGWKAYDKLHELNGDEAARLRFNDAWRNSNYQAGAELVKIRLGSIADKTKNVAVKEGALKYAQDIDMEQLRVRKAFGDQIEAARRAKEAAAASAAAARALKNEKLSTRAGSDVQDLVKAGVSEEQAQLQVYLRPEYKSLRESGNAPESIVNVDRTIGALRSEALSDLSIKKPLMSEQAYKKYEAQKIKEFNEAASQLQSTLALPTEGIDVGGHRAALEAKKAENADKNAERTFIYNGKKYEATNTTAASKAQDLNYAVDSLDRLLNRAEALRVENSGGTWGLSDGEDQAEAASIQQGMIAMLGVLRNTGAMDDKEYQRQKEQIPMATDIGKKAGYQLKSLRKSVADYGDSFVSTYGREVQPSKSSGGKRDIVLPTINFTPNK